MTKPDSVELALYNALRYEEATLNNVTDFEERWGITSTEREIVLKWVGARMKDIEGKLNG